MFSVQTSTHSLTGRPYAKTQRCVIRVFLSFFHPRILQKRINRTFHRMLLKMSKSRQCILRWLCVCCSFAWESEIHVAARAVAAPSNDVDVIGSDAGCTKVRTRKWQIKSQCSRKCAMKYGWDERKARCYTLATLAQISFDVSRTSPMTAYMNANRQPSRHQTDEQQRKSGEKYCVVYNKWLEYENIM